MFKPEAGLESIECKVTRASWEFDEISDEPMQSPNPLHLHSGVLRKRAERGDHGLDTAGLADQHVVTRGPCESLEHRATGRLHVRVRRISPELSDDFFRGVRRHVHVGRAQLGHRSANKPSPA